MRDRLGAAIGDDRVLLVLDNCEHVVGEAAELVGGLLLACPRLVVVATSRQSLGVAGERLVEVGSLDLPAGEDVAAVAASGAGALFVERAQAVHARFQLDPESAAAVAEVCWRLEGLPLAIELVAARARLLTAAQIADRLEETLALPAGGHGGGGRHQTIRSALVWSYDLLSEAEQELFRRLAVFRSSFILDAAAAVAPVSGDILSVLGGLVDKSLVVVVDGPSGERRFRLIQPVRQFAAELLDASGERDDTACCHRDHLLSRLPTLGHIAAGSATFEELAAEVDNLRAAVDYSMRSSQPEWALKLITSYAVWWPEKGLLDEQLDRLATALRVADPARMSLDLLSAALSQASTAASDLGRVDEAAAFVEQLAELRDQHPENLALRSGWAFSLAVLTSCRAGGDRLRAKRLMQECQHLRETRGLPLFAVAAAGAIAMDAVVWDCVDDPDVALALKDGTRLAQIGGAVNLAVMLAVIAGVLRVIGGASDAYPSCLAAFTDLDVVEHRGGVTTTGMFLAVAAETVRDYPIAAAHALRWVRFCRRSGVRNLLTLGIRAAARLSSHAGYPAEALRLWGGAEHIEAVTGMQYLPLMERLDRPLFEQCVDALGSDAARLLAEGASWSVAEATQAAEEALLRLQENQVLKATAEAPPGEGSEPAASD